MRERPGQRQRRTRCRCSCAQRGGPGAGPGTGARRRPVDVGGADQRTSAALDAGPRRDLAGHRHPGEASAPLRGRRLRAAVPRHVPARPPPVVRHDALRQPDQGPYPPQATENGTGGDRDDGRQDPRRRLAGRRLSDPRPPGGATGSPRSIGSQPSTPEPRPGAWRISSTDESKCRVPCALRRGRGTFRAAPPGVRRRRRLGAARLPTQPARRQPAASRCTQPATCS